MQDNVGTIVIGTKVNTKGATKDIEKLYQQIEREQDKIERLLERKQSIDLNIEKYKEKIEEAGAKTDELANQLEEIAKTQLEINGIPETIENIQKMKEELSSFDLDPAGDRVSSHWFSTHLQAEQYQKVQQEFDKYVDTIDEANAKLDLEERKQSRITKEIQKSTAKQEELNQKLSEATGERGKGFNIAGFEKGLGKVSDKFSAMLKKVGKIALALVGVRTIINLITRSFNTLTQYNEELGTKMEQMRLVLAVGLEPVINWLVSMLHTILSLVNQISIALSGINLFGRASELWSKKMAKNLGGASGSAKELKKQLAGFDEMNVLQDPSASSGGGGTGGGGITPWTLEPMFDWSKFDIGTIMEKAKEIVGKLINTLNEGLKNADPQEISDGITDLIVGLLEIATMTFRDFDWQKFGEILMEALLGMDWAKITTALIENIIWSLVWPIDLLIGLIDGLVKFFESPDCLDRMIEAGIALVVGIVKGLGTLTVKIVELGAKLIVAIVKITIEIFKRIYELGVEWVTKIINFFKNGGIEKIKQWIKDFTLYLATKTVEFINNSKAKIQPLIDWFKEKIEFIKSAIKLSIEITKDTIANIVQWIKDRIHDIFNFFNNIIIGIQNTVGSVVNWIKDKFNTFVNFFKGIGIAIGDFFSGAIKGAVNGILGWVEDKVNWFINAINNVINLINKIPGVSIGRLSRISLPRLATGGIINNPGKGVPVGGAIAGESGREGILPLTDRQAMAELGKEIGKWININATIPVNIGNRQIARVIQEINNDREFAMNS